MAGVLDPLVVVLGVSTAAQVALGALSWRFRPLPGARPLAALMATTALWGVGSIASLLTVTVDGNVLATQVGYTGISFVPVAWLFLSLEYAGRESRVTRRTVALASVVPLLTVLFAWTHGAHELLWRFDGVRTVGSFVVLSVPSYGPWFWVHTAHSYLLLAAGTAVFLRTIAHAKGVHRYQVAVTLAAVLVPWASNVAHLSGLAPVPLDPTPFVFAVSGGLFAVACFRYRLLELPPIARDAVLEEMDDGVVVLDHEDRVADVNRRAVELLDLDEADVVGRPAAAILPRAFGRDGDGPVRADDGVVLDRGDDERVLNLRTSPLRGRGGRLRGRVVLVRDVTVRERQRRELERRNEQLERQNERLEEFTGIVSHDLRNPLTLASAHLDRLAGECDSEHLEPIAEAHAEMEGLVEGLLTLARQGEVVGESEPVSLATVVEAAAARVEREGATVVVADDLPTVEGDPGRLQQLFENLFRNAVEHGSTSPPSHAQGDAVEHGSTSPPSHAQEDALEHAGSEVTVRVESLGDGAGFYVADDGPGIPADERERVFESGYTDGSSGTGLGLAIVESVAHAHGWAVSVTESAEGGARFEVVTAPDEVPDDEGAETRPSG